MSFSTGGWRGPQAALAIPAAKTMTVGGHFAALEQPDLLAEEVRAFFRPCAAGS
ncbi:MULTISPECIES: hypothetical protein [unclassified Mesorhizobium]|uniref:hypothetical protein n=1 Tax=unclassified Mesorhizobium TaxID=325217 RepID=UPI0016784FF2|nr:MULTISPECIES: hypothetical protein [unclassified Mesorhizobium]